MSSMATRSDRSIVDLWLVQLDDRCRCISFEGVAVLGSGGHRCPPTAQVGVSASLQAVCLVGGRHDALRRRYRPRDGGLG